MITGIVGGHEEGEKEENENRAAVFRLLRSFSSI